MTSAPTRVLHVLNRMSPGGVEVWLMHVVRLIDRDRFKMDFLVQQPGRFDNEIRALGSKVIVGRGHRRPWVFAKDMQTVLCEHGPYDVVHSHVHHYSGIVLTIAKLVGIPVRIAHSHNGLDFDASTDSLARRAYMQVTEKLIRRSATSGIACSQIAAISLFGEEWKRDGRWEIMPCGIDLKPFQGERPPDGTREKLGIPQDAVVLGHVGSFTRQKNHAFLIEVAAAVMERNERAHLLLVGDGPLRTDVEAAVRDMAIAERVTFAGLRDDVPALMRAVMDVFVFPSLFEGSPLVIVETQAAGLPAVISDTITSDIVLNDRLVFRKSLQFSAEMWAEWAIDALHQSRVSGDRSAGFDAVKGTVYDSSENVKILEAFYGPSSD